MNLVDIPDPILSPRQKQFLLFTGLDVTNNEMHSIIFQIFTENRGAERLPLSITMLTPEYTFYSSKKSAKKVQKSAKGFIKIIWFSKYLMRIPALTAVFIDLNWNHPSWNEKVTECESKISSIRASVGSSDTRICLVVMQQGKSVSMDDPLASERAAMLCQSCQLSGKQLFILPLSDQIHSYVLKLEAAFYEIAQSFYSQCLKNIRARSIPNSFTNLIIRQQFKLAFIAELKQETSTALRHYKNAYNHCTETEVPNYDLFELCVVAELINFKICQLSFQHVSALEAIWQQQRHISTFFNVHSGTYPSPQLAFIEHNLWKSRQCTRFAELFEHAVSSGLAAVSTQHPGIHWLAAAEYYRIANSCISSLASVQQNYSYPAPDPLTPMQPIIFYGQRPWRTGIDEGGLAAEQIEVNARIALTLRCTTNHNQCILLLSSALNHYKRYKCQRTQRYVMFLLGTEYAFLKQHPKALQLVSHVLSELCREEFFELTPTLLIDNLTNAFLAVDVREFMSVCMQMMNSKTYPCFHHVEEQIVANFNLVRSGSPPTQLNIMKVDPNQMTTTEEKWKAVLAEGIFYSLKAPLLNAFIEARAFFVCSEQCISAGNLLPLMVILYSHSRSKISFNRLKVSVGELLPPQHGHQQILTLHEFLTENVELIPHQETSFIFNINLASTDYPNARQISVSSLCLELGSVHTKVYGALDWNIESLKMRSSDISSAYKRSPFDRSFGRTSLFVSPRAAKLRLIGDHKAEPLLGEIAQFRLCLESDEKVPVTCARVEWNAHKSNEHSENALKFLGSTNELVASGHTMIGDDDSDMDIKNIDLIINYCAQSSGPLAISITVIITVDGTLAKAELLVPVVSKSPFKVNTKLLTINNVVVEKPYSDVQLFALFDIEVLADMAIKEISLKPDSSVEVATVNSTFKEEDEYGEGEKLNYCAPLHFVQKPCTKSSKIGNICIRWRRCNSSSKSWIFSSFNTGTFDVREAPITITADVLTPSDVIRTPIPILFKFCNKYCEMIDLEVNMEMADYFVFAGNKKVSIRLLPLQTYDCTVSVIALMCGRLPFPRIVLRSSMFDAAVFDEIVCHSLPATLFVLPIAK